MPPQLVRTVMPPTPQFCWPLLSRRLGAEVWVKHENHTPIGAFKLRGGLVYLDELRRSQPGIQGVITATRGNHGQSIAYAALRLGLAATIVVPHGNSVEKNRAMQAFGATLVEAGHDFQAAYEYATARAASDNLHLVRSFDPALVRGVASYGLELFRAVERLDTVYVPVGLGSGICGMIAARAALGETAEIVGVVAENAPAYALVRRRRRRASVNAPIQRRHDRRRARLPRPGRWRARDHPRRRGPHRHGVGTRDPAGDAHPFQRHAQCRRGRRRRPRLRRRPPGAQARLAGKRVAVVLSGGNIDRALFAEVLAEAGPGNRGATRRLIDGRMGLAYKLLDASRNFSDSRPNDQRHYQLIDGVIVAMAPPRDPAPDHRREPRPAKSIRRRPIEPARIAPCAAVSASPRRPRAGATISRPTSRSPRTRRLSGALPRSRC